MKTIVVGALIFLLTLDAFASVDAVTVKENIEEDDERISTSLRVGNNETLTSKNNENIADTKVTRARSPSKRKLLQLYGQVVPIKRLRAWRGQRSVMEKNDLISVQVDLDNEQSSTDINGNSTADLLSSSTDDDKPEELPEPLELRYARPGKYRRRPYYSPPTRRSTVNRRNVYPDKPGRPRPTRRPTDSKRAPTENECTFFSKTVCLEAVDYPMEAIMRSIRNNKEMVAALLTDFKVQDGGFSDDDDIPQSSSSYKTSYDNRYDKRYDNPFETSNEIKRKYEFNSPFDNVEEGFTCPSQVKYAKPQLARAASGVWKYIINTGEHTQTLRLEKCSNPKASCSFISENYRSSCMQVYNYHRLLTWDSKLGLHMDIFKVPTCCSCHVHGYTDLFPPHQTDPPLKPQELFPGADFATGDHHLGKGSSHINKYANSIDSAAINLFRENYGGSDQDETQLQHSSSSRRPSIARPPRPRKPSNPPRPFDKLPQQHAPNTRAPGYKGPRPHRPNRPFRRESAASEIPDYPENPSNITLNRFSQAFEPDTLEPSLRLQHGGFDDEYQETQRRVNYNYHPIIDFFKPEAAMLKSEEPIQQQQQQQQLQLQHQKQQQQFQQASAVASDHDSWKPIFKP